MFGLNAIFTHIRRPKQKLDETSDKTGSISKNLGQVKTIIDISIRLILILVVARIRFHWTSAAMLPFMLMLTTLVKTRLKAIYLTAI